MQSYISHQSNGTHLDGIFSPKVHDPVISKPLNTSLRRLHGNADSTGVSLFQLLSRLGGAIPSSLPVLPRFKHQSRYVYTLAHGVKPVSQQRIALSRVIPLFAVISLALAANNFSNTPGGSSPIASPVQAPIVQPIESDPLALMMDDEAANNAAVVRNPSWATVWKPASAKTASASTTQSTTPANTASTAAPADEGGRGAEETTTSPVAVETPVSTETPAVVTPAAPAVVEVTTPTVTVPVGDNQIVLTVPISVKL